MERENAADETWRTTTNSVRRILTKKEVKAKGLPYGKIQELFFIDNPRTDIVNENYFDMVRKMGYLFHIMKSIEYHSKCDI